MSTTEEKPGVMDQIRGFRKDVVSEFWKVSWPSRQELRDSTIVVIVTVIIVSAFIGIVDRVLTFGVGKLFG
jgi:preprotein translocase subunit SecE